MYSEFLRLGAKTKKTWFAWEVYCLPLILYTGTIDRKDLPYFQFLLPLFDKTGLYRFDLRPWMRRYCRLIVGKIRNRKFGDQ